MQGLLEQLKQDPQPSAITLNYQGIQELEPLLPHLASLSSLQVLSLEGNRLTGLPDLSDLRHVDHLDIKNNFFRSSEDIILALKSLPSLRSLEVTLASDDDISAILSAAPHLTHLNGALINRPEKPLERPEKPPPRPLQHEEFHHEFPLHQRGSQQEEGADPLVAAYKQIENSHVYSDNRVEDSATHELHTDREGRRSFSVRAAAAGDTADMSSAQPNILPSFVENAGMTLGDWTSVVDLWEGINIAAAELGGSESTLFQECLEERAHGVLWSSLTQEEDEGSYVDNLSKLLAQHKLYDMCFKTLLEATARALPQPLRAVLEELRTAQGSLVEKLITAAIQHNEAGSQGSNDNGSETQTDTQLADSELLEVALKLEQEASLRHRETQRLRRKLAEVEEENRRLHSQLDASNCLLGSPPNREAFSFPLPRDNSPPPISRGGARVPPRPPPAISQSISNSSIYAKGNYGNGSNGHNTSAVYKDINRHIHRKNDTSGGVHEYNVGHNRNNTYYGNSIDDDNRSVGTGGSMSECAPPKVMSLKQTKEVLDLVYASKAKYDAKCLECHLPLETLEQHMTRFLTQRYGLKRLASAQASSVLASVAQYESTDSTVATFSATLRHDIDEGFRDVQDQLLSTVTELLRLHIAEQFPTKPADVISSLLKERTHHDSWLSEQEWWGVLGCLYGEEDAGRVAFMVRAAQQALPPRRRWRGQRKANSNPLLSAGTEELADGKVMYGVLIEAMLTYQLKGRKAHLAPYRQLWQEFDTAGSGVISSDQFISILRKLQPDATMHDLKSSLMKADPGQTGVVTFSWGVSAVIHSLNSLGSVAIQQTSPT